MSGSDIQVILNELIHIKADIAEIKEELKDKCESCKYVSPFRERLKSQWTHITFIWGVIASYFSYLLFKGK